jgi:peptide/nickel transport system substrate-binding protein
VVLEGGNLGLVRPAGAVVMFHGREAEVLEWSPSRLTVQVPMEARGAGLVFVVVGSQPSNVLAWESTVPELTVEDLQLSEEVLLADEPFDVQAILANPGGLATPGFAVQWSVDGTPLPEEPHGPLQPGQRSSESSTRRQLLLGEGVHTVRFVADPGGTVPGEDRARRTFLRRVQVRPRQSLALGDFRGVQRLDPLRAGPQEASSVLGLIFRGLGRREGPQGEAVPDLAEAWSAPLPVDVGGTRRYAVTVTLRGDSRFHDGTPVTAEDVRFTFQRMRELDSPWRPWAARVLDVTTVGRQVTFLLDAPDALTPLLGAGIVPRATYEPNPDGFGLLPVGSGPFQVETFTEDAVGLRAFRGYFRGAPRLDRVTVALVPDLDRLGERLEQQEILAAVMPYDGAWYERLRDLGEWQLTRVVSPDGQELLHAQSPLLLERKAQARDFGAAAHLWYLRG